MSLKAMMTSTATTTRHPAPDMNGKIGARATWLEDVKVTPVMLASASGQHYARQASGFDGTSVYQYEAYTESHEHTEDSVTVTQLPDIRQSDLITIDGLTYVVKRAAIDTPTSSFGKTLYLYLDLDS